MQKPTRYFVVWDDADLYERLKQERGTPDISPDLYYRTSNSPTLAHATRFFTSRQWCAQLWERYNIRDVTPAGDPRGLLWDWQERMLKEN